MYSIRTLIGIILYFYAFYFLFFGFFQQFFLFLFIAFLIYPSNQYYKHRKSTFANFWGKDEIVPDERYITGVRSVLNQFGFNYTYIFLYLTASNAYLLAKADGRVTQDEMRSLRKSLTRHFGQTVDHNIVKQSIDFTKQYIQSESQVSFEDLEKCISYNSYIFNQYVMNNLSNHDKQIYLILYFQILYEIIYSINLRHPSQIRLINYLITYFNLPSSVIRYIENLAFYAAQRESAGYRQQYQQQYQPKQDELNKAYQLFGLSKGAGKTAVKKAFRKLAKEYHPDRYMNMPQELKDQAEKKFQLISNAYELLMKYEQ